MLKWIKGFIVPALAIPVFFAGWFLGYHTAYKRGKNMGYVEGYRYAASAVDGAVKEYLEARDRFMDVSIDLMEYKIKLQEKEGGK